MLLNRSERMYLYVINYEHIHVLVEGIFTNIPTQMLCIVPFSNVIDILFFLLRFKDID